MRQPADAPEFLKDAPVVEKLFEYRFDCAPLRRCSLRRAADILCDCCFPRKCGSRVQTSDVTVGSPRKMRFAVVDIRCDCGSPRKCGSRVRASGGTAPLRMRRGRSIRFWRPCAAIAVSASPFGLKSFSNPERAARRSSRTFSASYSHKFEKVFSITPAPGFPAVNKPGSEQGTGADSADSPNRSDPVRSYNKSKGKGEVSCNPS